MAFFPPEKLQPRTIEIDDSTANCDSPEMQRRLDRLERHYGELNTVLEQLETKLALDERLTAIDDDDFDFESEYGIKPKRKWRSPAKKTKQRKRSSASPRKPR